MHICRLFYCEPLEIAGSCLVVYTVFLYRLFMLIRNDYCCTHFLFWGWNILLHLTDLVLLFSGLHVLLVDAELPWESYFTLLMIFRWEITRHIKMRSGGWIDFEDSSLSALLADQHLGWGASRNSWHHGHMRFLGSELMLLFGKCRRTIQKWKHNFLWKW